MFEGDGVPWVQLIEILEKVQYGDFKFRLDASCGGITVIITTNMKCNRTGATIVQNFSFGVSEYMYYGDNIEEVFLMFIRDSIISLETHEAMEKFRYKGEMIFDPHLTPGDGRL